jgi:poly(3-hydroxybutyrate) depolymerase
MKVGAWALLQFTILAAGMLPDAAATDNYPPLDRYSFAQDGVEREFFVYAPEGASSEMPVVLAIHGYTSTATGFAAFHDLREHASEHGYIVVFPQGTHFVSENAEGPYRVTSWNLLGNAKPDPAAGPQCIEGADRYPCPPECGRCGRCTWASCHDDLAYFDTLLDMVASTYRTDRNRYYALGMSNGGMMTLRLGCERSRLFAAIAPIAAQMPEGYLCRPDTLLPMLHLSGGKDDVVRPDGKPSEDGFLYESVDDTTAAWALALECEGGPQPWETELSRDAGFTCSAYSQCAAGESAVILCSDPDETHNWPARRPGGAWPTCVTSQQVETLPEQRLCEPRLETGPHRGMDVIWEFFQRFERKADRRLPAN